jgi:hypothetical protein
MNNDQPIFENRITIVSGIPRSGTSMMMQMLKAGGLELLVDNERKADDDNPRGYFEFEKVKQLRHDKTWINQAEGKVIKVITQLLPDLPADRKYKVILMNRDIDEVLASQSEMLKRRGESGAIAQIEELRGAFEKHSAQMGVWLKQRACFDVLEVQYAEAVENPRAQAEAIVKFLGVPLDINAMIQSVSRKLYRHVKSSP